MNPTNPQNNTPVNPPNASQLPNNSTSAEFATNLQPGSTVVTVKKSKAWIFIVLAIFILGGGGVFAWFKLKPVKKTISKTPATTVQPQITNDLKDHNFFQMGSKVISYDNKSKKSETLIDKIPAAAAVLDLYADKDTWRLYYTVPTAGKQQLFYLEKDVPAVKLAENENMFVSANAQAKLAAYTYIFSTDPKATSDNKTNRTFIVKDGKSSLLLQSKSNDANVASSDVKSSKYAVVGVSKDASKVLMGLFSCFNCGGPAKATAFEVKVADTATEFVQQSEDSGTLRYAKDGQGFVLTKSLSSAPGFSSDPYNLSVSSLDKVGGSLTTLFTANEATWGRVVYDQKANYIAVEKRASDFTKTGKTTFDSLYYRGTSKTVLSLGKMTSTGLDSDALLLASIGEKSGSCSGVWITTRDPKTTATNELGVLCYTDATHATYTKVDNTSKPISDTTQTTYAVL